MYDELDNLLQQDNLGSALQQELQKSRQQEAEDYRALRERYAPNAQGNVAVWLAASAAEPQTEELASFLGKLICGAEEIFGGESYGLSKYLDYQHKLTHLQTELVRYRSFWRQWEVLRREYKALSRRDQIPREIAVPLTQKVELLRAFTAYSGHPITEVFSNNLAFLFQLMGTEPVLKKTGAYFLYRVFVQYRKRLCTEPDFLLWNFHTLFTYKEYSGDADNGKNFSRMESHVQLFQSVCTALRDEPEVDLLLCRFLFAQTSNLSDWYFYKRKGTPSEEFLEKNLHGLSEIEDFSLFPNGFADVPLLQSSDMDPVEFLQIWEWEQTRTKSVVRRLLDHIAAALPELVPQYLAAYQDPVATEALCCGLWDAVVSRSECLLLSDSEGIGPIFANACLVEACNVWGSLQAATWFHQYLSAAESRP